MRDVAQPSPPIQLVSQRTYCTHIHVHCFECIPTHTHTTASMIRWGRRRGISSRLCMCVCDCIVLVFNISTPYEHNCTESILAIASADYTFINSRTCRLQWRDDSAQSWRACTHTHMYTHTQTRARNKLDRPTCHVQLNVRQYIMCSTLYVCVYDSVVPTKRVVRYSRRRMEEDGCARTVID